MYKVFGSLTRVLFCLCFIGFSAVAQDYGSQWKEAVNQLESGKFSAAETSFTVLIDSGYQLGKSYVKRAATRYLQENLDGASSDLEEAFKNRERSGELYLYRGKIKYLQEDLQGAYSDLNKARGFGIKEAEAMYFLGNCEYNQNQYRDARESYLTAIAGGVSEGDMYYRLAKTLTMESKYEEALPYLDKAISINSGNKDYLMARAEARFFTRDYKGAISDYEGQGTTDGSSEILERLATAYYETGNYAKAAEFYEKAVEKGVSKTEILQKWGKSLYLTENYNKAIDPLEKAFSSTSDPETALMLGISLGQAARLKEAYSPLKTASDNGQSHPKLKEYLAKGAMQNGDRDTAYLLFGEMAQNGKADEATLELLVDLALEKGEKEKAISYLESLSSLKSDKAPIYYQIAGLYKEAEDESSFLKFLDKTLSADANHQAALSQRGLLRYSQSNYSAALSDLEKVSSPNLTIISATAISSLKTRGAESSKSLLEAAVSAGAKEPELYAALGKLQFNAKEMEKAEKNLSTALASSKDDELLLMRGQARYQLENFAGAAEDLGTVKEMFRSDPEQLAVLGKAQFKSGKKSDAVITLQEAVDAGNNSSEVLLILAQAQLEAAKYDEAITSFNSIEANGGGGVELFMGRGMAWQGKKNDSLAVLDYTRALQIDPKQLQVVRNRARAAFNLRKWSMIIGDVETIQSAGQAKDEELSMLGLAYFRNGQKEKALSPLQTAAEKDGLFAEAWYAVASLIKDQGDSEKALEYVTKAIEQGYTEGDAIQLRAALSFDNKNYSTAVEDYESVIKAGDDSGENYYRLGFAQYETGSFTESAANLSSAIEKDAENKGLAYYMKGNAEFRQGNYREAVDDYLEAEKNGYDSALLFNNRGKAFSYLDDQRAAIDDYTAALERDPSYTKALRNRASSYYQLEQYKESLADLETYKKQVEEMDAEAIAILADCYYRMGEFETSLDYIDQAIAAGDDSREIKYRKARALMEIKEIDKSMAILNQLVREYSDYSEAYNMRARGNLILGKLPQAKRDLDKVISLDESNFDAWYNRALIKEAQDDYEGALEDYEKVLEINPNDSEAYYSRANAKLSLGRFQTALMDIDRAINLENREASYYKVRGNIYYRLEEVDNACTNWQKAFEMGDGKIKYYIDRYCQAN